MYPALQSCVIEIAKFWDSYSFVTTSPDTRAVHGGCLQDKFYRLQGCVDKIIDDHKRLGKLETILFVRNVKIDKNLVT